MESVFSEQQAVGAVTFQVSPIGPKVKWVIFRTIRVLE